MPHLPSYLHPLFTGMQMWHLHLYQHLLLRFYKFETIICKQAITFYSKQGCKLPKDVLKESKNVILYEYGSVCVLAKMVTLRP